VQSALWAQAGERCAPAAGWQEVDGRHSVRLATFDGAVLLGHRWVQSDTGVAAVAVHLCVDRRREP